MDKCTEPDEIVIFVAGASTGVAAAVFSDTIWTEIFRRVQITVMAIFIFQLYSECYGSFAFSSLKSDCRSKEITSRGVQNFL